MLIELNVFHVPPINRRYDLGFELFQDGCLNSSMFTFKRLFIVTYSCTVTTQGNWFCVKPVFHSEASDANRLFVLPQ